MSEVLQQEGTEINRWQTLSLIVGVVGLAACIVGALFRPDQFFRSYLLAYIFWVGLALGCLGILMMQYVTGGAWGLILRRALESATRTLPLLALFFVPLLFGVKRLYVWTNERAVAADSLLQHKSVYLNTNFFITRAAVYFIVWAGMGLLLVRWSRRQDETAEPQLALRLQRLSAPGLFFLAVTVTLALIDWVMSLEPRWYSTVYAVGFMAGEILAGFAFSIAIVVLLADRKPFSDVIRPKHFRDLGNLLLTFVMLWAYCAFSQYLLIWSGNLRAEIPWYLRRTTGGWGWVAAALILFHFFLPFFLLLSRALKRDPRRLVWVAAIVIMLRFVDVLWLIIPAFYPSRFKLDWMDLVATLGLGGVWLAVFFRQLKRRPLLPTGDPYAKETFSDE